MHCIMLRIYICNVDQQQDIYIYRLDIVGIHKSGDNCGCELLLVVGHWPHTDEMSDY